MTPTSPTNNVYGNLKIINGAILNCDVEVLAADPTVADSVSGRLYFNSTTKKLRYFNGTQYNDSDGGAEINLIQTLGSQWVNTDYTFNPDGFSGFTNVTGLSVDSSLLDVLSQFDSAIRNFELVSLLNIKDVQESSDLENGQVLYYNGKNFTFGNIDLLMDNFSNFSSTNLKDVSVTSSLEDGQVYVYSVQEDAFTNKTVTFNYVQNTALPTHTINHGLNTQYPVVTLVDLSTNTPPTGATVSYTGIGTLTVSFQTPVALAATIMFV